MSRFLRLFSIVGGTILGTMVVGMVFVNLSNAQTKLEGQQLGLSERMANSEAALRELRLFVSQQAALNVKFQITFDNIDQAQGTMTKMLERLQTELIEQEKEARRNVN